MVGIQTLLGPTPIPILFQLWHVLLRPVAFDPGFPLTLAFHNHQLWLGMGRHVLVLQLCGLHDFIFIHLLHCILAISFTYFS
jgi:hypothetical protein